MMNFKKEREKEKMYLFLKNSSRKIQYLLYDPEYSEQI